MGLPDGEEIMTLAFFVLTQYPRVTDRRIDGRTRCDRYIDWMIIGHHKAQGIRYDWIAELSGTGIRFECYIYDMGMIEALRFRP